jgi:hypothetical protein
MNELPLNQPIEYGRGAIVKCGSKLATGYLATMMFTDRWLGIAHLFCGVAALAATGGD